MPTTPPKVDRDALHRYLYRKANKRGRLQIRVGDLGEDLGLTRGHMGRILQEMVEAGRLRKAVIGVSGVATYAITNPDEWAVAQGRPRVVRWG